MERADLCVSRVEPTSGEAIGRPAYIESKRAFRWTTHLTNIYQPNVTSLRGEIANDILKVRRLAMQSTSPAFRGYILVWNITDQEMKTKISPHDYLKPVVDEDFRVWQIRSAPLATQENEESTNTFSPLQASVSRWLWVALVEVTPLRPEDIDAET